MNSRNKQLGLFAAKIFIMGLAEAIKEDEDIKQLQQPLKTKIAGTQPLELTECDRCGKFHIAGEC